MRSPMLLLALAALAALARADLFEVSQVLWERLLDGGFAKVGRIDPISVPVVKVEQTEGNMTYRVFLRNLEIGGLNTSRLESVNVVRGRLHSNLSDSEAGYVSYNEQQGLDSIRYRFHTLVKEPRSIGSEAAASEEFARILEYDPQRANAREENPFISGQQRRNLPASTPPATKSAFGDVRVSMAPKSNNPSLVRVVYTHNYKQEETPSAAPSDSTFRPCVGACRRNFTPEPTPATAQYPQQPYKSQFESQQPQQQQFTDPRYSSEFSATQQQQQQYPQQRYGSRFGTTQQQQQQLEQQQRQLFQQQQPQQRYPQQQQQQQPQQPYQQQQQPQQPYPQQQQPQQPYQQQQQYPQQVQQLYQQKQQQQPQQQQAQSQDQGIFGAAPILSGDYRGSHFSVSGTYPGQARPAVQAQGTNNFETRRRIGPIVQATTDSSPVFLGNGKGGPFPPTPQDANAYRGISTTLQPPPVSSVSSDYRDQAGFQQRYISSTPANGFFDQTTGGSSLDAFEPFIPPMVRIEKQPGFVDIVYAREQQPGVGTRSDNIKSASSNSPRVYSVMEVVKDLNGKERYILHNFTEGESLSKRNDMARAASESRRLKDLVRYAGQYQEQQGFFEQGLELIYHFGSLNTSASNETLRRTKRQQQPVNETSEEDLVHIIVRVRVPNLSVRARYALVGTVGQQPLRGSGLLTGNFTDVTADFTVELKKVDNKTIIVRAARAKLISKDQAIKLEGMDEKGPLKDILNHGLMASEAVAAMIADDLATKILNDGNSEGTIFRLYKDLPANARA